MLNNRNIRGGTDRSLPVDQATSGWPEARDAERAGSHHFFSRFRTNPLSPRCPQQMAKRPTRNKMRVLLWPWRAPAPGETTDGAR